jgi:hypothetical protein
MSRDRLRIENRALQEENRRERVELDRALDALERLTGKGERRRPLGRVAVIAVAAGAAYVLGAKAGRERFDQISAWWARARTQVARMKGEANEGEIETVDRGRVSGVVRSEFPRASPSHGESAARGPMAWVRMADCGRESISTS